MGPQKDDPHLVALFGSSLFLMESGSIHRVPMAPRGTHAAQVKAAQGIQTATAPAVGVPPAPKVKMTRHRLGRRQGYTTNGGGPWFLEAFS